jgi:multiple sugar transport system substrate-binding protein
MDKLTTLEGGIGCRLSTWADPEVNALIPFYSELPRLSASARTLPRSRSLPALVAIIDDAVQAALNTDEPTASVLARAQAKTEGLNLAE